MIIDILHSYQRRLSHLVILLVYFLVHFDLLPKIKVIFDRILHFNMNKSNRQHQNSKYEYLILDL